MRIAAKRIIHQMDPLMGDFERDLRDYPEVTDLVSKADRSTTIFLSILYAATGAVLLALGCFEYSRFSYKYFDGDDVGSILLGIGLLVYGGSRLIRVFWTPKTYAGQIAARVLFWTFVVLIVTLGILLFLAKMPRHYPR
jgi:hypothetical protein